MTILSVVYASAPAAEVLIPTLEIGRPSSVEPIRTCAGFENHTVTLETGEEVTFEASGLDVSLPERSDRGQQRLIFAICGVTGEAQRYIDQSIEAGETVEVIYREYLSSDLSAPARRPLKMLVTGAEFLPNGTVQVEAAYRNILNWAWPRRRYTASWAPGLLSFR